ncbi:hypothetical protein QMG83_05295 [Salinibacterium sp. G-O1]|uniref:hypothetical protein n=1 Tax=Salinibacterium sp. G-O1 TaxID=3046208 RepID=UPI0024BBD153|nr:hypothetical protein [Salinibacterium sp. G-O1]MDJ0334633.1 hypothetical protein [Salinibacterium sp. G-O1]
MPTDESRSAESPARAAGGIVRRLSRLGWLRAILLHPVVARPGFWFATACAWVWGGVLGRFRMRRAGTLVVASGLPKWAYGRGGTTIGAVYLTTNNTSPRVLEHEAVHCAQWKKYGLALIPLYLDAGRDARLNRFEIEAGLAKGGYGR